MRLVVIVNFGHLLDLVALASTGSLPFSAASAVPGTGRASKGLSLVTAQQIVQLVLLQQQAHMFLSSLQ